MLSRVAFVAAVALATLSGVQAGTRLPSHLQEVVSASPVALPSETPAVALDQPNPADWNVDAEDWSDEAMARSLAAQEALVARNYQMPWSGVSKAGDLSDVGDAHAFGVDISQPVGMAGFQCMKAKGYKFAIARIFQQTCNVDPNGRRTVEQAWAGGMEHVDVYLFPSYGCRDNAATQVNRAIDAMGNTKFGTLWLDIEAGGHRSHAENQAWLNQAVAQAKYRLGAARVGIYSSQYMWSIVIGAGVRGPTDLPAWYAHYDGNPSFNNFLPFGGWTRPAMKQFAGDVGFCGANVDLNWW